MSTPRSEPAAEPARERELDKLARKWAYQVSMTAYIPLPHKEIERVMRELAQEVFAAVTTELFDEDRAAAVGERLVELHCVGRTSLRCSVDVLASALTADERLQRTAGSALRIARVLNAVACGYTDSVRWQTVDQQTRINQALQEAVRNAEQSRQTREAQRDEAFAELSLLRSELGHQLLHDVRTGLPNRQFFTTRLEQVLNMGSPTTVYHLEVDGLGTICDGLGRHDATGLLKVIAERLTSLVADGEGMVARFDSGRFAILVETEDRAPDPAPVVARIKAVLAEPAIVDGVAVIMSASVGVVQSPPYPSNPATVLHAANLALRRAQRLGAGHWATLVPHEREHEELWLAATLPTAWRAGDVGVEFRPQIRLSDGRPTRLDARLRWDHAELGTLAHDRCVSLAERTGFDRMLGRWLLDQTGERLASWSGDLPVTVPVASGQATDPGLLATIGESGLPAERLQVSFPAGAAGGLATLAEAGLGTALHDFGGTAGDVTCLSDAPVHAVRLASRLTRRAGEPIVGRAVRDLVALAHQAGAIVVVDDLRTGAEADWWRAAGADLATGPLYPLPAELDDDLGW
ncbi:EAL domain-containing protein [Actinophytocola oryzae]|uniref:Diguanylate cyclase (GGDEF)-like protein n=1 Tax=Actinophytocola oryzae TaxID=502181 RepID=A0A4R7URP7_9PSEU|nr:EAL domain-containing protein [Actinophytocola oryzae]TDV35918.1 diguanylate cyclase (GGDEF)-like protein [Actinophytocola oryzae]